MSCTCAIKKTLELFPLDRQLYPLDERTFRSLSLSLSHSLSRSLSLSQNIVLFGIPSFIGSIEPRFYMSLCHWMSSI